MAWVAADLTAIEKAIAKGILRVQLTGGSVEYRNMDDLIKARNLIKGTLDAEALTPAVRTTLAKFSKG